MYPDIVPVTSKYIAQKFFVKAQADHEKNIKNARSVVDQLEPTVRPHCSQRTRQKQIREHKLAVIKQENERLLSKIKKNGASIDSHNHYVSQTLNTKNRQQRQAQHENEFQRLQKRISQVQSTYSAREYQEDYGKNQVLRKRMSRFSWIHK